MRHARDEDEARTGNRHVSHFMTSLQVDSGYTMLDPAPQYTLTWGANWKSHSAWEVRPAGEGFWLHACASV